LLAVYDSTYFERGGKYAPKSGVDGHDPNRANEEMRLRQVLAHCQSGRLLDVGCATGGFLEVARENGFDVVGVEVSGAAAECARRQYGLEVLEGDLSSASLPSKSVDVVTMWDVIEHLPDPGRVLLEAARVLRPGGVLLLTTGDSSSLWARVTGRCWPLLTPPQHLFFFTPLSLKKLLAANGFSSPKIVYPGKRVRLGFILFKARESFGPIVAPLCWVASMARIERWPFRLNLRDVMMCISRRTA